MASTSANTPAALNDWSIEPKDHLTALPSELLHMIIGYLFPSHEPDKAFVDDDDFPSKAVTKPATHTLDYVAATCRALRGEVNGWCRTFLTKHSDITSYKPLKTNRLQARRNFMRGRGGLLVWIEKHCVFCGRKSARSAILMNGLHCCAGCDKQHWPDKITKTDARKQYDLQNEHLLPQEYVARPLVRLLARHPGGLPKLRYGTYVSSNVRTTMFLRSDVEKLAKLAHGDLKEHLARKQADREERRRKAREVKAQREALKARRDAVQAEASATVDPRFLSPWAAEAVRPTSMLASLGPHAEAFAESMDSLEVLGMCAQDAAFELSQMGFPVGEDEAMHDPFNVLMA